MLAVITGATSGIGRELARVRRSPALWRASLLDDGHPRSSRIPVRYAYAERLSKGNRDVHEAG
jgi:NAD(P)-dependent dehydrogenase (short-subunit alcohol dehydrogenase family)